MAIKRELERTRLALTQAKSWHVHYVEATDYDTKTIDEYIICPSFRRQTIHTVSKSGSAFDYEAFTNADKTYFRYLGRNNQWQLNTQYSAGQFKGCGQGPLIEYGAGLPLDDFIQKASIKRGIIRSEGDVVCRDYEMSYPTPGQIHPTFDQTLCIDEQDHLPRQVRHPLSGKKEDSVTVYSEWNQASEPELPSDLPLSNP